MESEHQGEPIQIIKLNPGTRKPELNEENVKKILLHESLENVELSILSIAGAFRKGKSFLLSYILRYLMFHYRNDRSGQQNIDYAWLGDQNARLSGFGWRGGCDRHTTGIWMWSKIFTTTMPNGKRIGIILMDTQGMFDHETDMNTNVTIFALSTMLSSIQIFNVFNNIQEDDLQHLQLFTEYGRIAMQNMESDSKPFQQVMFLIRDWNFPTQYAYGLLGGNRFLHEKVLKVKEDTPSSNKAVREHIRSSFNEATCFLMPNPGENVTRENFDGRTCDIAPQFIKQLNDLIVFLLKPENICRSGLKELNGIKVTPKEFYNLIQQYWKVFKSGKIPEAKNILEASTEAMCLAAKSDVTLWYFKMISQFAESTDVEAPQLLNSHKNLVGACLKKYDKRIVMGDLRTRLHHRQELKNVMQENVTYFLAMNQSKNTKSLNETITNLTTEINQLKNGSQGRDNELLLTIHKQLQDFLQLSHDQQMSRIEGIEKIIVDTSRPKEPPKKQRGSGCSIM